MSQHEFEMTKRQPIDKGDDSAYDPMPLMRKKTMTIVGRNTLLEPDYMGKQYRSGMKRTREDQDEMKFRQFKLKHGQDPDQPRTSTQAKKKPRKFDRKAQKMLSKGSVDVGKP